MRHHGPLGRIRRALDAGCGALAAAALFAIMWLTLVDVAGRKAISTSLPGSLELTELLMVVVIFAALPLVSVHGEHVVFDSLDRFVPRGLRAVQRTLVELVCAALLAGCALLMWDKARQMREAGDITAQLGISLPPFVQAMAVLFALTAFVHLLLVAAPPRHHHPGVAEEEGERG